MAFPAVAIYRGTMFSDRHIYKTPPRGNSVEGELSDAAHLHPRTGKGSCDILDKVLDGTPLAKRCRLLCDGKPKASAIKAFCDEARSELETPYILSVIQGNLKSKNKTDKHLQRNVPCRLLQNRLHRFQN
jgi:hypothetical protein